MPTDIYIGDTPIEEAYLGDDPIQMDDNNVCRPCYGYSIRKGDPIPPDASVTASNCYNNDTFEILVQSQVPRVFFASEIIDKTETNTVFQNQGLLSDAQGGQACKNAYGKEEYLPCESWTFTSLATSQFLYSGWKNCNGEYELYQHNLAGFVGDTKTVCAQSGSWTTRASSSYNGPC